MSGQRSTGRLQGQVAVVTGAGSGIGQAVAAGFAREGARVLALDRAESLALTDLGQSEGARVMVADVTDEAAVESVFQAALADMGGVDVLAHCAGIQLVGRDGALDALDLPTWRQTLEVNLTGTFLTCRAAARAMLAAGRGGSIMVCGSPTSLRGTSSDYSAYSSSKGGVHALVRVIATEYGPHGIRANTLVPGPTQTGLTEQIFADADVVGRLVARVPLGRLGLPVDYVGAALFLATADSAFMTGAELVVDGGYIVS